MSCIEKDIEVLWEVKYPSKGYALAWEKMDYRGDSSNLYKLWEIWKQESLNP